MWGLIFMLPVSGDPIYIYSIIFSPATFFHVLLCPSESRSLVECLSIKGPVLNRFGHIMCFYFLAFLKIGNSSCYP